MSEASAAQIASKHQSVADQIADGCLKFQPVLIDMLGPTFPPIALFTLWCSTATSWLCFLVNSGNLSPEDMPIVRSMVAERFVIDCLAGFGSIGKDEIERGKISFVQGCQTVAPIIVEWMDGTDNSKETATEILELPYFGEYLDKKQKIMTAIVLSTALISVKQEAVLSLRDSPDDNDQTETRLSESTDTPSSTPSPSNQPVPQKTKKRKALKSSGTSQSKRTEDVRSNPQTKKRSSKKDPPKTISTGNPDDEKRDNVARVGEEKAQGKEENSDLTIDVTHRWTLAAEIYPHIEKLRSNLEIMSATLAVDFVQELLRTRKFEQADDLFSSLGNNYLVSEFGENMSVLRLATELLESGKHDIAVKLKETLDVVGKPANTESFIDKFCAKNDVTRNTDSELLQALGLVQTPTIHEEQTPPDPDKYFVPPRKTTTPDSTLDTNSITKSTKFPEIWNTWILLIVLFLGVLYLVSTTK
jgi:hypothetical protein